MESVGKLLLQLEHVAQLGACGEFQMVQYRQNGDACNAAK